MSENQEKKPQSAFFKGKKINFKEVNWWKLAFLSLLGVLLGTGLFLVIRMSQEREPAFVETTNHAQETDPSFQVSLKKQQVNDIISFYLNDFLKDSGVQYDFYLEDQALLSGTFKILGYELKFYLYFDPYVLENGNVQLKARSVSIGTLSLPISEIMKYVSRSFEMPDWVEVQSDEQTIILHLDQFKLQNGMYVKAEKINLIDDDIRFNVYLPISKTTSGKE